MVIVQKIVQFIMVIQMGANNNILPIIKVLKNLKKGHLGFLTFWLFSENLGNNCPFGQTCKTFAQCAAQSTSGDVQSCDLNGNGLGIWFEIP